MGTHGSYISRMCIHLIRSRFLAAIIATLFIAIPGHAIACMFFDYPDKNFWAFHATGIVDATVVGIDRMPLSKPGSLETSYQGPATWVLQLNVHNTLRGDASDIRLVATRFWHTSIVDEDNIRDLLGVRKEFAIVDSPSANSQLFSAKSVNQAILSRRGTFPPHDGFHVLDANGEPLDEIWEGSCVALPIFELGTFNK